MNKNVVVGIALVVLVVIGIVFFKPKSNNSNSQNQAEDIVENAEKQIDQKAGSTGIIVPANIPI